MLVIRVTHEGRDTALSLMALNLETYQFDTIGDLPKGLTFGGDAMMVPHQHRFYAKMIEPESPLLLIVGVDYRTGQVVDVIRPVAADYPLVMFYYPICLPMPLPAVAPAGMLAGELESAVVR